MSLHTDIPSVLHRQLEDRRERLRGTIAADGPEPELVRLLQQVDAALDRQTGGSYGACLVCDEYIGDTELLMNPLLEYCLCGVAPEKLRALESDLELARRIQAGLLPEPRLRAAGWRAFSRYEPAGPVSGDFVDLWAPRAEPDSLYFAVGDVSGKGVAAALLMTHIQAAFRSLLGTGAAIGDVVAGVNRQLLRAGLPSHYATLAAGRVDRAGRVELVNAGHCPPLLLRGGDVQATRPTGFPVGLIGDRPYEVDEFTLDRGDALVLYTDGVTEAWGSNGDPYGQERLEVLLAAPGDRAPRALVDRVRGDVAAFQGGASPTDDLTILALGYEG